MNSNKDVFYLKVQCLNILITLLWCLKINIWWTSHRTFGDFFKKRQTDIFEAIFKYQPSFVRGDQCMSSVLGNLCILLCCGVGKCTLSWDMKG